VTSYFSKRFTTKFLFRLISGMNEVSPIEVYTHPFQQTSQPQQFNIGAASCAVFLGMVFILLPITLAVDIVYDREVRALLLKFLVINHYISHISIFILPL